MIAILLPQEIRSGDNVPLIAGCLAAYLLSFPVEAIAMEQYIYIFNNHPPASAMLQQTESQATTLLESQLAKSLYRVKPELSDIELSRAAFAISNSVQFLQKFSYDHAPFAWVSDDGFAAVRWENGIRGVLLIFPGDNTVTVSLSHETRNYAHGDETFEISERAARNIGVIVNDTYA
jgi:hypothetical protein